MFSTWPPAEDVPAFRGAGAAGRRCALFVLCMGTLIGVGATVGSLLGDATSLDASVSEWFAGNSPPAGDEHRHDGVQHARRDADGDRHRSDRDHRRLPAEESQRSHRAHDRHGG